MKTMGINNIFHIRSVGGRNLKQQPKINMSDIENTNLCKRLHPMENSLNYMAAHYNIKFDFNELPISKACFILCEKDGKLATSDDINETDPDADIAHKIYVAASEVL